MTSEKTNIKLIIKGCLDGNAASERKLFDLYYGYIKAICQRYAPTAEEAEEMLNDTYYTTFTYLNRYDSQYDFKPWIRKVCVNCCLKYLKKYNDEPRFLQIEDRYLDSTTGEELETLDGSDYLRLIKKLPTQYRTVFNLFVFEEYKHQEIAEMLQISVGSSKSNLSRAKDKLLQLISEMQPNKTTKDNRYG